MSDKIISIFSNYKIFKCRTYKNRSNPCIECKSSLDVTNTDNHYKFFVKGEEPEKESWGYLLGKIFDQIEEYGVVPFLHFE